MHQTYFKEDMRKKRQRHKKPLSKQAMRSNWIKLCLCLWGLIIVKRDKHCQWCGDTKGLTGHHIVTRGSTAGYKLCWFDLDNGVCLCQRCHGIAHGRGRRKTIHDYVAWIDKWLAVKGLSYKGMNVSYSIISRMSNADVQLQYNILRADCEGMGIPYTENPKYKRLRKKIQDYE